LNNITKIIEYSGIAWMRNVTNHNPKMLHCHFIIIFISFENFPCRKEKTTPQMPLILYTMKYGLPSKNTRGTPKTAYLQQQQRSGYRLAA
jgi:hypothetical protein